MKADMRMRVWVVVVVVAAAITTSLVSAFTTMPIVVMPAQQYQQQNQQQQQRQRQYQSSMLFQATRMNNNDVGNDNNDAVKHIKTQPQQQQQQQQKKKRMSLSKSQKKEIMNTKLLSTALVSASVMIGSALAGMAIVLTTAPPPALAASGPEGSKVVGELKGSGLVFKDTLQIERFEDPKVRGVELYISNFQRPLTEKLNKGFFNDPSQASVACARTGKPVSIASNIEKGTNGGEVFQESKSLLFKTLRVQRIYDEEKNTVVYVSYNTRLDKSDDKNKSRFQSTLCAINLDDYAPLPTPAPSTTTAASSTATTIGAPATAAGIKVVK